MKQQDIDNFLQEQFELDCPRIELIPCHQSSSKRVLSGSGCISLVEEGYFNLKVYFLDTFPIDEIFDELNWVSGKLIGDEAYYNLAAYDISGNKWEAERFITDKNNGPNGSMIIGKIPELRKIEEYKSDNIGERVQLYFNEAIEVPFNTSVKEEEIVEKTTRKVMISKKMAIFGACGIDFEIKENNSHTILAATSDVIELTDIVINRIYESFCFVTSHTESWSILVIRSKGKIETRIRAVKAKRLKSRTPPPISYQHALNSNSVWRLFDCYLKYVLSDKKNYFHPISTELYSVIESGKLSLDVEALILSVSIESLLKKELNHFCDESDELSRNIDNANKLITNSDALDCNFKKRLMGSISNMKNLRAKDILLALINGKLVDESLVRIYSNLRNKAAHGDRSSGADVQSYYNDVSAALVLFFQLLFLIINYNGDYTDYGTYGYPKKQFNGSLS